MRRVRWPYFAEGFGLEGARVKMKERKEPAGEGEGEGGRRRGMATVAQRCCNRSTRTEEENEQQPARLSQNPRWHIDAKS